MTTNPWSGQVEALGRFIHAQRKLAKLALRELAGLSDISKAYLSQLEDEPATPDERPPTEHPSTEAAIRADPGLTEAPREALQAVLRSFSAR